MEAVIGLLVMILGVSHGVETSCDGRQDGAQCYGALGGTVVLRLMDSASEIFRYHWSTKTTRILYGRKNLIVSNEIENRSSFTPSDGTFRINNLSWNDDGVYKLTIYDSNGMISEQRTLHLSIQGEETSCDGRQDGAQCYGALGGTVVLRLMDSASEIFRYHWSTKTTRILYGRKDLIVSNEIENRSSFTPSDGTFRINNLSWSDEGEYTLEIYDSDGRITEQRTLQLTIQGVETSCDGRQDGAQCYGALGGTVVLRLMDSASEKSIYRWSNKTTTILNGRKNQIMSNRIENRSSFTPSDGTFRVSKLSRSDEGEYTLEIYDSNGRRSEQRTLQLTIQAPVSSVLLVSECLSQGEMRVSCSSEGGDSPQYSWTLDGHTLTDAELLSGNTETTNITLKQHVSGELVCSVRNNVSSVSKEMKIINCGFIFINCILPNATHISQWVFAANNTLCIEPTTAPTTTTKTSTVGKETVSILNPSTNITSSNETVTPPSNDGPWYNNLPVMAGVLSALVLLLLIGVAVICSQRKKKNSKPKEEDDQELTYADVRIVQRQGMQMQQRQETQVEYGEVKFSERPRQPVEPAGDDCMYAKVRKAR
ncbi:pregnancy-specific glycoprotein 22 isoform X3 [Epinephelus moara]|uniref:pregnancy-specific glycoprotein 22 isoform X3 n=1 Tax=Epinephelus moara TaxID=300413 RepID=UPI00214F204D|nr:pregnancy-specific glycoprotein 22 isoform X3 [Epinephelus moara]